MAINKGTQYITDPNTIPVDTSTGSQTLPASIDDRVVYVNTISERDALSVSAGQQVSVSGVVYENTGVGTWENLSGYVTPEIYGAAGDDSTDDTQAIESALASFNKMRLGKGKAYRVNNLTVPDGSIITGVSPPSYRQSDIDGSHSIIRSNSISNTLLQIGDWAVFENVTLDGVDKSIDMLSSLSGSKVRHSRFINSNLHGFNRAVWASAGIGECEVAGCNISDNETGITNILDSKVIGGFVNANTTQGIFCGNGANDNTFVGVKNEFNSGNNWAFSNSVNNTVIGGVTDRSSSDGININNSEVSITGVRLRRNGSGSLTNAHIAVTGTSTKVTISGCTSILGADDGGGGNTTPSNIIRFDSNIDTLVAVGNDFTGKVDEAISFGGSTATEYLVVTRNAGSRDFVNGGDLEINDDQAVVRDSVNIPSIASGATSGTFTFTQKEIDTFSTRTRKISLAARNTDTGATRHAEVVFSLERAGSGASMVQKAKSYESTADSFGTAGADLLQINISNVSSDGFSFDFTITNNDGSNAWVPRISLT